MRTVTKILTAVASENVPDFVGIATLSTFFLLLNPFSHHRLKVLGNLFSSSLPIFRIRMTWLSFSFPYFDSVLFVFLIKSSTVNTAHLLTSVKVQEQLYHIKILPNF